MKAKEMANESSMRIALRVKALERMEKIGHIKDNAITLVDQKTQKSETFDFDHIFDMSASNGHLFDYFKGNIVSRVFDNTNCCFISLGQPNSGKTFSLFGNDSRVSPNNFNTEYGDNQKNVGIVQKIFDTLLSHALSFQDNKDTQIFVSMFEVHKEAIRDLAAGFDDSGKTKGAMNMDKISKVSLENLEISENTSGQLMIKNLSVVPVGSSNDLTNLLGYGVTLP